MILKTIPAAPFAKERQVSLFYFEYLLGSANAEQFGQECFISCEKVSASVPCANKGLCPFETYDPFKKVSIPNFLDRFLVRLRKKKAIDFGVKPFKKGLAGFKRTESFVCMRNR